MKKIIVLLIINCFAINYIHTQTFTNYNVSNSGLKSNNIYWITIDKNNTKWLGTDSGLTRYDGINWTTWTLINSNHPTAVTNIAIDNQNNKWLASRFGLYKFDGFNWVHYTTANSGIKGNFVNAVAIDSLGNIVIGTNGGVSLFNGVNWITLDTIAIMSIAVEPIGSHAIWATADEGVQKVFKYLNNTKTEYNNTNTGFSVFKGSSIYVDKQNNVWLASRNYGLYKFDQHVWYHLNDNINLGNPINSIYSIAIDEFDNKWCGNGAYIPNSTIMMYNDTNWSLYSFSPTTLISSIAIDSMGNKWMALPSSGLWKMDCQVPATPTAIHGSDTVTKGQMAVGFKIAHPNDALFYNWVLPNGFTGSSTSDSIIINIDSNAVSGVISVFGYNSCGNGLPLTFNVTVIASQVGINEETNLTTNISVYPNPASDKLTLSFANVIEGGYILEVYNHTGVKVLSEVINQAEAVHQLNTTNLKNGIYFISVRTNTETFKSKFTIIK